MSDFTQWKWSKEEPWKVRNSELIQFLSDSGRYVSCPVCPHSGNWTFHVDNDWGATGPDPYLLIYTMQAFTPVNLTEAKYRGGFFTLECPKCAHLEWIPCSAVASYFERKAQETQNGAR